MSRIRSVSRNSRTTQNGMRLLESSEGLGTTNCVELTLRDHVPVSRILRLSLKQAPRKQLQRQKTCYVHSP